MSEVKTIKELNLEDDFLFAKVMSDTEICKEVLEKILNVKIEKIIVLEEQKVIDLLIESKGIRLDVYVQDENNTVYNVEMQRGKNKNLPKRFRYYQGNIDLDLISKGEDYKKLKNSFVIFICTFDLFGQGRHVYTFENRCIEDSNLILDDGTKKIILNTKGILDDVDSEMHDFLRYIENTTDMAAETSSGNLVKHIHEKVKEVKNNKIVEVEYMTLLERDREKIEQGIEQGIEIGKAELLIKLLTKKFKTLPKLFVEKIKSLPEDKLEEISMDIFDMNSIEDLKKFF